MKRTILVLFSLVISLTMTGQLYLGQDTQPLASDSILALPDFGIIGDFEGGVEVGELMHDFQIYDLSGNAIRFFDELRPDKYTILFSLSITCDRVQYGLNPNIDGAILDFYAQHGDDFNWVGVYTDEAHPIDLENCPSNCPAFPTLSLNGDSIYSHQTYADRAEQAANLLFFSESPSYGFTYPFDNLYLDNPDNPALVEIFRSPFTIMVVDCAGYVIEKAPFMNDFFGDSANWQSLLLLSQQADTDQDQVCNAREEFIGTDPNNPCDPYGEDSDGDGECDVIEQINGTDVFDPCDPIFVDLDEDGICDFVDNDIELPPCVEDPTDSDFDGICDAEEMINGTDPNNPCDPSTIDSDGDGLCNNYEFQNGSSPYDPCDPDNTDSDGDGYCDFEELGQDSDPNDPCSPDFIDSDGDGICNLQEIQDGSGPGDACDPFVEDSDLDGFCDVEENLDGTDPNDPCDPVTDDNDEDGICNTLELINGSDPEDACDPDDTDTDGDGTCDNQEILDGTDPFVDESVGISEYSGISDLKVFPNPVTEILYVQTSSNIQSAELFSTDGRGVALWNGVAVTSGIDVSNLAAGSYILRVVTNDSRFESIRLIK